MEDQAGSSKHDGLVGRLQNLLSSQQSALITDSNESAAVLSQLLQPEILNGTEEQESIWCALCNTPAPVPHPAAELQSQRTDLWFEGDGTCVSFPLNGTLDQVVATPYDLVQASEADQASPNVLGGESCKDNTLPPFRTRKVGNSPRARYIDDPADQNLVALPTAFRCGFRHDSLVGLPDIPSGACGQ